MRDPRKNSAYASGMRGQEKPKVAQAHGKTMGQDVTGIKGGEHKQGPTKEIGDPDGVSHLDPVYRSGMRGLEKGNQKPAKGGANYGQEHEGKEGQSGGSSKSGPNTQVGNPDGEQSWAGGQSKGIKNGVGDAALAKKPAGAYKLGIPGNNTEQASQSRGPVTCAACGAVSNTEAPSSSLHKKKGAGQAV